MQRRRAKSMAIVLCALAFALSPPASALPAAPAFPQVVIKIAPVPAVNVETDGDLSITANGSVNITLVSFVEASVSLNVTITTTYWAATITPTQGTVMGSGEVPFAVTVTVPGRSPVDSNAQIQVEANVSAYGVGKTFTNATPIPILQYFGVNLTAATSTSPERFDAAAGAETSFAFRLQNLGNGKDTFEVRVSNLADLQSRGINIDVPSPVSNVGVRVTVNVNGRIALPASIAFDNYAIDLLAVSTGAVAAGKTVTSATAKTAHVVAAPPPVDGGTDANNTTKKQPGLLPGFEAPVVAAAAAMAAAALRRFRPPSQGAAYRGRPVPSQARGP